MPGRKCLSTSNGCHMRKQSVVSYQLKGLSSVHRALTGPSTPTQRRMPCLHGQRRGRVLESEWVWWEKIWSALLRLGSVSSCDSCPLLLPWFSFPIALLSLLLSSTLPLPHAVTHMHTLTMLLRSLSWSGLLINKLRPRQPLHTLHSALTFFNKHQLMQSCVHRLLWAVAFV